MLIGAIIVLVFYILLWIFIDVYYLYFDKKRDYEIRVKISVFQIVFLHVILLPMSLFMPALAVYAFAFQTIDSSTTPFLYVGIFVASFFLFIMVVNYSFFVAIKDENIYYRYLFKINEIKIRDIRTIDVKKGRGFFVTTINGASFNVSCNDVEKNELLKLINERKNRETFSLDPNIKTDIKKSGDGNINDYELNILNDIGKRYRENYKIYRRKTLLKYNLLFYIILSLFLTFSIALTVIYRDPVCIVPLAFCFVLFVSFLLIIDSYSNNLKKELEHDDAWLGYKHRFDDERVIGNSKRKMSLRVALSVAFLVFGVSGSVATWFGGTDVLATTVFYICISIAALAAAYIIYSIVDYKKHVKKETIELKKE